MSATAPATTVALNGRWALVATTYSFLADPRRSGIELIYRGGMGEQSEVQQETRWLRNGRTRHLLGSSKPLADGSHRWRGRGLGGFVTADWSFAVVPGGAFAVIRFAATLLSDAGYHVLARRVGDADQIRDRLEVESASLGLPRTELASLKWRRGD